MLSKHKNLVIKTCITRVVRELLKSPLEMKKMQLESLNILKNYHVPVVVQEFLEDVIYGDKRVILIDGKPEGVINRIPKKVNLKPICI